MRWQRFETAAVSLPPKVRSEFVDEMDQRAKDLKISQYDIVVNGADNFATRSIISFSNADIEVLRGEPSLRRRFLDLEISQVSPAYVYALAHYLFALCVGKRS